MSKTKYCINYRQLSSETGHDRASLAKWFAGRNPKSKEEAMAIIDEHDTKATPEATDSVSGLSWFQASMREDTLRKRRVNEEAEAIQQKLWMRTDDVLAMLRLIVSRLEQLPAVVKSEAGLSDAQALTMQRKIDDMRTQIADDIEALTPAKEKEGA